MISLEKNAETGDPCFSLTLVDDWYNFVAFNREADKEQDIDKLEERMLARKKALNRGLKGETGDEEVEKRVRQRRENRVRRGRRGGGGGGEDDDEYGGGGDDDFAFGGDDDDFEDEFSEGSAPDLEISDADNDDAADEPERDEDGKIIIGDDDFDEGLDEESEEDKDKPNLGPDGKPIGPASAASAPAAPPASSASAANPSSASSIPRPNTAAPLAPAALTKKRVADAVDGSSAAKKPKTDGPPAPKVHEVPFTLTVDHLIEIFVTKGFKTSKEIMEHFKPLAANMRDGAARLNELFKQTFTWDNKELKTVRVKKEYSHLAARWQMNDD